MYSHAGRRETVGYDTSGDGRIDSLDTNRNGHIDARIVREQNLCVEHESSRSLGQTSGFSEPIEDDFVARKARSCPQETTS